MRSIKMLLRVLNHRDVVLALAIICGLILGDKTRILGDYSIWTLTVVMIFSTTGFSFRTWKPFKNVISDISKALFLNYLLFGVTLLIVSNIIPKGGDFDVLRTGILIIAASPAGPSIIAFTGLLKGNLTYSVNGVFGITLASLGLTPLLLFLLVGTSDISPRLLFPMLLQLIVVPLIMSRILRHKNIIAKAKSVSPTIVKWGFFLVIVPTVGLSRDVIFSEPLLVIFSALVFFIVIYGISIVYFLITKKRKDSRDIISGILLTVVKSSAFSAVVAFSFFEDPVVALPSAVLSIFVTTFYITFSLFARKYLNTD